MESFTWQLPSILINPRVAILRGGETTEAKTQMMISFQGNEMSYERVKNLLSSNIFRL